MKTQSTQDCAIRANKTDIIQTTAERLIDEEVLVCQTKLVAALLGHEALDCFTTDEMHNAWCQVTPGNDEVERVREWWLVSTTLAASLKHLGQTVLDNGLGQWWGRSISGQPIVMDGTMQHVARLTLSRDSQVDVASTKTSEIF